MKVPSWESVLLASAMLGLALCVIAGAWLYPEAAGVVGGTAVGGFCVYVAALAVDDWRRS